jgi:argininosuccinate lyase
MKNIWQKGSVKDEIDRSWFETFTATEDRSYDEYLIPHDILGNIAQAKMLKNAGILSDSECESILTALRKYYELWEKGEFHLSDDDEDVHSAIEKHLTNDCGDAGKKIHTGRSRNDQVQTDIRIFVKDELLLIAKQWINVLVILEEIIQNHKDVFFAGTTHTQPAMPTSVDAWAAGYQDLLLADLRSLVHVFDEFNRSPLGSAAGYGTPYFDLDRTYTASLLGFSEVQVPVTAVQLNRGVNEKRLCDALGYGALTFNRMASDVVLFANPLLGYVDLSDDQVSGSSIMPQKRNPDAWELIRGNYSFFAGFSSQLTTISANLISGYHRDLQVTKKVLMDAIFRSNSMAFAVGKALGGLQFNTENCDKSLTAEVFATHEANRLVASGMPFREAYRKAAESVQNAQKLSTTDLKKSYLSDGCPGRYDKTTYDRQKSAILQWISNETQKKEAILNKLLHEDSE